MGTSLGNSLKLSVERAVAVTEAPFLADHARSLDPFDRVAEGAFQGSTVSAHCICK
jgi:hypothetical protein